MLGINVCALHKLSMLITAEHNLFFLLVVFFKKYLESGKFYSSNQG